MNKKLAVAVALTVALAGAPKAGPAQSVVARTPNLAGGWTAPKGVIQFNLLHRFSLSPAPLRKVTNTPTLNVGTGLTDNLMVGFVYGSNSSLVPAYPNEWEFYARALPLSQARGSVIDASVQAGYNVASESIDGALLLARSFGRLKLLAQGRAFSEAYDSSAARFAVTGGASLGLTPRLSLAGDYGVLLDRTDLEAAAWGVGLQVGVPYTPHSLSIHATNIGTASLEGMSRGSRTRWGFEYTIPITVRRYVPRGSGSGGGSDDMATDTPMDARMDARLAGSMSDMPMGEMMDQTMGDTVHVEIKNLKYQQEEIVVAPGTTVVFHNGDPVQHTVIADDGMFDSGLIGPNADYSVTFVEEGTHAFHCMPHPFMTGRVVVRAMMDGHEGSAEGMAKETGR
jgi:plastocyanin